MAKIQTGTLIEIVNTNYDLAKNLEIIFYKIPYSKENKDKKLNIKKILKQNRPIIQNIIKEIDYLLGETFHGDFSLFGEKIYPNFIFFLRNRCLSLRKYLLNKNDFPITNNNFCLILSDIGNNVADFIYHFSTYQGNNLKKALQSAIKAIQIKGGSSRNLRKKFKF